MRKFRFVIVRSGSTMRFAGKFLYWSGGAVLLVFIVAVFLPSSAHVERSVSIDAHAATIFALLNDFEQVNKWSPWADTDPNARFDVTGPARGVGAAIRWEGSIIGHGAQTIIESVPFERIVSRLDLSNRGEAIATFTLSENAAGTLVNWAFDSEFGLNLLARYIGLMLDGVVGSDYEKGLLNLKTMAESLPRADFSAVEIEHIMVEASDIAYLTTTSIPEPAAIAEATGNAYFNILSFIDDHGLQEAGAPIIISRGFSGAKIRFDAGIPVRGISAQTPGSVDLVKLGSTYAGAVIRVKHVGSYSSLGQTHGKIAAYLAALGIERNGDAWESYLSDPTRTAESDLITYVYYPVRHDRELR